MSYSHLPLDTKSGDYVEGVPMIGYSYPPTLDREGGDNLNYPSRLNTDPASAQAKQPEIHRSSSDTSFMIAALQHR